MDLSPNLLLEFPVPHGWNSAPAAPWGDSAHEQCLFCFTTAYGEGAEVAGRERWVSVGPRYRTQPEQGPTRVSKFLRA